MLKSIFLQVVLTILVLTWIMFGASASMIVFSIKAIQYLYIFVSVGLVSKSDAYCATLNTVQTIRSQTLAQFNVLIKLIY